ncbi:MMPL family transporter [Plantactinospora siamensis]|uniref:MMPL family transporter n=2 Tax=Plantactinospora siamensis TaxID=555372 RepID=A0ABV6NWS8_9ACTN
MMRTRTAVSIAVAVVVAWLAIGAFAGPYSGKLAEVSTNDNASFLPAEAEATKAQNLAKGFVDRETTPALVVYERAGGVTDADKARAAADAQKFAQIQGVVTPLSPPIPSQDGQALQVVVPIDSAEGDQIRSVTDQLRTIAGTDAGGLSVHVAGPAGILSDLVEVFSSIDGPLLLVTLAVVLVILLIVYRSPILWIIPLLAAGMSYTMAAVAVYFMTKADLIKLNGQSQGILTVLVFGAGTDYALLMIARYREELHHHARPVDAMKAAWRGAAPAILASGLTVIAGLLCLLLSSLNSNRSLGPVSAVGIGATLIVMLTLLPALLLLGGRWAFWPRVPRDDDQPSVGRIWRPVGRFVGRRARPVWLGTSLVLVALAFGLTQLGATKLGQTEQFTQNTDSKIGQEVINRHFPGGQGSPVTIFTTTDTATQVAAAAKGVSGVTAVQPLPAQGGPGGSGAPGGSGQPGQGQPGQPGQGQPGQPGQGQPEPAPKVVDGRVQLQATLAAPADSQQAEETVRKIRTAVHAVPGAQAVVGGFTAIDLDTADASVRDRNVIIPVVLAVIAVILALLLRSIVAPLLLIVTVVLSFLATLGLCSLLFTYVFGFPGVDAAFPLFAFVFLVALGIDYNIFLMTRVREESGKAGTRTGVLRGLVVTGGVITSAGVVLAATFSALAVLPLVVLVEIGVAVAAGVLLDTIIVRSLLVPALTYDIGRKMWWPSALSRADATEEGNRRDRAVEQL